MLRFGILVGILALFGGSRLALADSGPASLPTHVAPPHATAGQDTIPPTILRSHVVYDPAKPDRTSRISIVFSEPVEALSAILYSNYIDVNSGLVALQGFYFPPDSAVIRFSPDDFWGFGTCEGVRVINVEDLAGNKIVDDGVTNIVSFHLQQLAIRGRMGEHMKVHGAPPHDFAIEGDLSPLTFSPFCDIPLLDADGDSSWTQNVVVALPCTTASSGPETGILEYRFGHECNELELLPNRTLVLDPALEPSGVYVLDHWWDDAAPSDHLAADLDVIFRVRASPLDAPFGPGDSLALGGSELPLGWDPSTRLLDDGAAPDDSAGDGIYTARSTFTAGTYRRLQYRFALQPDGGSGFTFECGGPPNRTVFLDDGTWSTANPLVLDVAWFNDCLNVTGVGAVPGPATVANLESVHPNPVRGATTIAFSLAEGSPVTLEIFDVRGRRVARLVHGELGAGRHEVAWSAVAGRSSPLPSGAYFARLVTDAGVQTRKIVIRR